MSTIRKNFVLIKKKYSNFEGKEQNWIQSWKILYNVFCLKQLIKKKVARNQKIHITFIDL